MDMNRHEFRMKDEVLTKVPLNEMELGYVCFEICMICEIRGSDFVILVLGEGHHGI